MSKRFKEVDAAGLEKLTAYIANNPLATDEDIIRKAYELGYNAPSLIDTSLGALKLENSGAKISQPLIDILDDVYKDDPTPGRRFILDPEKAESPAAKEALDYFTKDPKKKVLGLANRLKLEGKSRQLPDNIIVLDAKSALDKYQQIAAAGHELKHGEDFLIRPDLELPEPASYKKGHHYKDIYEPAELRREVRGIPRELKELKEIEKQRRKNLLPIPGSFRKLMAALSPISGAAALYGGLKSGDTLAATLGAASAIDPTGISDAALQVKERLEMSPEERKKQMLEDKYSAMPGDLATEARMLDQLQDDEELKIESELEKRKRQLGYK